jgi:hypothetical protein
MENALGLLKEVCEEHGAMCYLVAYDTISTALAEALKPSHNTGMLVTPKLPLELVEAAKQLHIVDAVGQLSVREFSAGAVAMYNLLERQLQHA